MNQTTTAPDFAMLATLQATAIMFESLGAYEGNVQGLLDEIRARQLRLLDQPHLPYMDRAIMLFAPDTEGRAIVNREFEQHPVHELPAVFKALRSRLLAQLENLLVPTSTREVRPAGTEFDHQVRTALRASLQRQLARFDDTAPTAPATNPAGTLEGKQIVYTALDHGIDGRDKQSILYASFSERELDSLIASDKSRQWRTKGQQIIEVGPARHQALAKLNGIDRLVLGLEPNHKV